MSEFVAINSENLYKAVYDACFRANIYLTKDVYCNLKNMWEKGLEPAAKMSKILANAAIACENKRPLCQDTGQVLAFVSIGSKVLLDKPLGDVINQAVEDCYRENFFRKSFHLL